mmetsp:Transcript_138324/g.240489  ORF Transcript_138324/g.240489 Transcript_138324/m.240489 type:complete len:224 (-) Transcript_138324:296-967(-)
MPRSPGLHLMTDRPSTCVDNFPGAGGSGLGSLDPMSVFTRPASCPLPTPPPPPPTSPRQGPRPSRAAHRTAHCEGRGMRLALRNMPSCGPPHAFGSLLRPWGDSSQGTPPTWRASRLRTAVGPRAPRIHTLCGGWTLGLRFRPHSGHERHTHTQLSPFPSHAAPTCVARLPDSFFFTVAGRLVPGPASPLHPPALTLAGRPLHGFQVPAAASRSGCHAPPAST